MKTKIIAVALIAIGVAGHAFADTTTANASQAANSSATAQGSIEFSQTPADSHISETVRNVSAPVLGAYASSFSQMNCSSTTQGGLAVAGFSGVFGSSKDSQSCVLEVASAELTRQSTIDSTHKEALQTAAIGVRCQVSEEVYNAMIDAGLDCKRKPKSMQNRTDTQPTNYRVQ